VLKIPAEYNGDTSTAKLTDISHQVFRASLLTSVFTGKCKRALLNESGMIRTQMGTQIRSQNGRSEWDSFTIPPVKVTSVSTPTR
jgi:hypothetical protein